MADLLSTLPIATLRAGVERRLRTRHPLIRKGEASWNSVPDGTLVRVIDSRGQFAGIATVNSRSQIPLRIISWEDREIDRSFFHQRFQTLLDDRKSMRLNSNAFRWVFAEGDSLPGLIIDNFDGHLAVQVRTLGMDQLRDQWIEALRQFSEVKSLFERSDMAARKSEGLPPRIEQVFGETPDRVEIVEGDLKFAVSIPGGLKTGHFLDQRETRRRVAERTRAGDRVLDCFCFTGGFSLAAASRGAQSVGIDLSEGAIELARVNARAMNLEAEFRIGNVFEVLESDDLPGPFDLVVLDPPGIGKTRNTKNSLRGAIWKLTKGAIPRVRVGGTLIVCVCTHQVSAEETLATVADAADEIGAGLSLFETTFQDRDHPAPLGIPEALYLKCLWFRRVW